jgi:hypothetical protein
MPETLVRAECEGVPAYHESLTWASRFGAFRAAARSARGAEKAAAPPAPRNRLQRIAHQLSHEKNFDHAMSIVPGRLDGGGIRK